MAEGTELAPEHENAINSLTGVRDVMLYLLQRSNQQDAKICLLEAEKNDTPTSNNEAWLIGQLDQQKKRIKILETAVSNLCYNLTGHDTDHFQEDNDENEEPTHCNIIIV